MAPSRKEAEAMNSCKKALDLEEKQLTRQFNQLDNLFKQQHIDVSSITQKLSVVEAQMADYVNAQKDYNRHLITNEEDILLEAESNKKADARDLLTQFRARVKLLMSSPQTPRSTTATAPPPIDSYRLRLPERKFQQFDGDVRNWNNFWASFEEYDKDKRIPAIEKYHLLLGAMVPGSRPYITVNSHVADPDSYAAARDELKDKFGRPKTIIKVYIRDLLKIVVDNCGPKKMEFTHMVTTLTAQLRNLNKLGVNEANSGVILYAIVESCIPREVLDRYLQLPGAKEDVTDIMAFLNREVKRIDETLLAQESFETPGEKRQQQKKDYNQPPVNKVPTATNFMNTDGKGGLKCGFCSNKHSTMECRKAFRMTLAERRNNLKTNNHCFKCLKPGHYATQCKTRVKCAMCTKGHYAILCPESEKSEGDEAQPDTADSQDNPAANHGPSGQQQPPVNMKTGYANYVSKPEVLLQTLYVKVYGQKGTKVVRAGYDSMNQSSYITTRLSKELGFPYVGKERVIHQTFGGNLSEEQEHPVVTVDVSGIDTTHTHRYFFDVSVVDTIGKGIIAAEDGPWKKECDDRNVLITDFGKGNHEVDLLIGNDVSPYLKEGLQSLLLPCGLVATESKLGWFLEGKIRSSTGRRPSNKAMMCINMMQSQLDVTQLWSLDAIGIKDSHVTLSMSEREQAAMDHFHSTVKKDDTGRFIVHLPWVPDHRELPDNRKVAVARLHKTTDDLQRDGKLADYHVILSQTWPTLKITEKVPVVTSDSKQTSIHYLPHRAVYKEGSTTPVRPVFNASCKSRENPSLNDCLEVGPNLLELIPAKLMGFRRDAVGVISDIAKAFLQIQVAECDRDALRFLWWESPDKKKIVEYRHCRVVFGVTSSPFLLSAVIKLLLQQNKQLFPETVSRLESCLYVDNCVASFASGEEAKLFAEEASIICAKGQFDLRGWEIGTCLEERTVSVLGLQWDRRDGTLQFDFSNYKKKCSGDSTKRFVLALAATVYDPLGLLSPVIIPAKILFKKICLELKENSWDDPLPSSFTREFMSWKEQLHQLENLKIPRNLSYTPYDKESWSLHVFSDASQEAFACAVYLRVDSTHVQVRLVQARARVTPSKPPISIPRAELLGCLIAARLSNTVIQDLSVPEIEINYYTDSTAALTWIKKDGNWGTFVQNRVVEVRRLTNRENWHHLPGIHNPADLPSRGCTTEKMLSSDWLTGPEWLHQPQENWPITKNFEEDCSVEVMKETKKKVVIAAMLVKTEGTTFMKKLLDLRCWKRILRFAAFTIRYMKLKFKLGGNGVSSFSEKVVEPTVKELEEAELFIIRHIQKETWNGKAPNGLDCQLNPDTGIWQVVMRLTNKDEPESFLRPAVLPGKN